MLEKEENVRMTEEVEEAKTVAVLPQEAFAEGGAGKTVPETAEAKAEEASAAILGKFRSPDALAKAYAALESEFTRRSQRLKELEKQVENFQEKPTASGGALEAKADNAEAVATCSAVSVEATPTDADGLYRAASGNGEVVARIVKDYLSSISKGAPLMKGGAGLPAAPTRKAASIDGAGELALKYFKKGS